ncbi:hypothetical protein yberc0001_22370 [Yersinia bercovieri ATCC 43970]|uniref:Uncharacterized protein n=1 Tax=Yersinia bercovieri ATCC 43970 TaxID=349968 RepID=A0ABM9Y448_YERBE|nr:hypothetical protein yberc0001_22370 [Yersinia bercovieri ATCC 43970]
MKLKITLAVLWCASLLGGFYPAGQNRGLPAVAKQASIKISLKHSVL